MGVTAIKRITNYSNYHVVFRNQESPHKPGNAGSVPPKGAHDGVDMWIPWCTSENEHYAGKYISIILSEGGSAGVAAFEVWQAAHDDGDFVRIQKVPPGAPTHFKKQANRFPPVSEVDGDRTLMITADGKLHLQYHR